MEDIIIYFMMLMFLVGLVYLPTRAMLKVNKKIGYNYSIRFIGVSDIPDLRSDDELRKHLRVVSQSKNTYVVQSRWNDCKLRDCLVTKYHLTKQQVIVQSVQASGPLGVA